MRKPISDYLKAEKSIFRYFGCNGGYFLKPLEDYKWIVKTDDGISMLTYWSDSIKPINSVIVKKDGDPLVYKKEDYTMIIGIDCVKIAFIFRNANLAEA